MTEPRVRASRRQNPTWAELFARLTSIGPNAKRREAHAGFMGVHADICDTAAAILKRPACLDDIDDDFALVVIRKFHKQSVDTHFVRVRIDRLKALCEYATSTFNVEAVDFDAIPQARRVSFADHEAAPQPEPTPGPVIDGDVSAIRLTKLLEAYAHERLIGKSPETLRLMKVAVKAFSKWLGRSAVVGDLTKPTVLRYIHAMTNGHLSPASVQTHLERILALWRFAAHNRWVADYPDIKPVHVPARTPEAWERDQLSMILDAARATTGKFGNVPRKLFWEALVRFLYDSGERIGAALAVRHDDISGEWINVRAELRKGRTRDKTYKLRPETLAAIAEIRKHDDGPLIFAWPLVRTYLWRLYGDLLVAAGLPSNRRSKFHKIRRTTASHFESAGGNSTELLDHDSRKTTKRSYLDPRQIKTVMPADIVPGIGQDTPPPPAEPTAADLLAKLQHLLK